MLIKKEHSWKASGKGDYTTIGTIEGTGPRVFAILQVQTHGEVASSRADDFVARRRNGCFASPSPLRLIHKPLVLSLTVKYDMYLCYKDGLSPEKSLQNPKPDSQHALSLFKRSMPTFHMFCVRAQIGTRIEELIVKFQFKVVRLRMNRLIAIPKIMFIEMGGLSW